MSDPREDDVAPVREALEDDLNTPAALAALHGLAGQLHSTSDAVRRAELAAALKTGGALLGLLQQDANAWAQTGVGDAARIDALVVERGRAIAARDWARADALRRELSALGVDVEDGAGASRWRAST